MPTTQESNGERTPPTEKKRPSTLSELRQQVSYGLCDKREPFKSCLERAEQSRKEGQDYSNLDPERAFVAFARAGYLLLVKLPMHPHYKLLLSDEQRRETLHDGQLILLKLIVLKGRIVDLQNEWAVMHAYSDSPAICSFPSPSRQDTIIIPRLRDIFTQKMDYRTEFEQLLGGKVEDPRKLLPSVVSSPQLSPIYTLPSGTHSETVHGTQSDGIGQKMEGIEFKVPERPVQLPLVQAFHDLSTTSRLMTPAEPLPLPCLALTPQQQVQTPLPSVPPLNTVNQDLRGRRSDHYYQHSNLDEKSRNSNPIKFEIKRWLKSRRRAFSASEPSSTFDSESPQLSSFLSEQSPSPSGALNRLGCVSSPSLASVRMSEPKFSP